MNNRLLRASMLIYRHAPVDKLKEAMPNLSDLFWEAEKMVLNGREPSDYETLLAKAREVKAMAAEVAMGFPHGSFRDNALLIKKTAERIEKGAQLHLKM